MTKPFRRRTVSRWAGAIALVLAAAASAAMPAAAADAPAWTVDHNQSELSFTARQMNAPSTGVFKKFTAAIKFDAANLAGSAIDVTVEIASAETGNKDIDKYLPHEIWFNAAKFPQARFVSASIKALGGGKFEAAGKLTLRGVTRDVTLPFTLTTKDAGGKLSAEAKGEMSISRLQFGIGQGEWKSTSVVAEKVVIGVKIIASRSK